MNFIYEDERIYLEDENKNMIAEIAFRKEGEKLYILDHTFVDISLRGKGIAKKLLTEVVKKVRLGGGKIFPKCSYAKKEFQRNIEFADVWENV